MRFRLTYTILSKICNKKLAPKSELLVYYMYVYTANEICISIGVLARITLL